MAQTFGPHALGKAVDQPVANLSGRFGGHIAGRKSCATSGQDQTSRSGMKEKGCGNQIEFVRQDRRLDSRHPC